MNLHRFPSLSTQRGVEFSRRAGQGGFMRVTFRVNYGVHVKDGTYEVPDWLGMELISSGKAIKEDRRGTDAPALLYAQKVMHPSQVKKK